MGMKLCEDMMLDYPPSLAAAKRLAPLAEGFVFFSFEWLGKRPEDWHTMKVVGAVFREAKRGPRKGERCIEVQGTRREAYLSRADIAEFGKKGGAA